MCLPGKAKFVCDRIAEGGQNVQRRLAMVVAACVVLGAAFPGSALGSGEGRQPVATPTGMGQSPVDFREDEITFVDRRENPVLVPAHGRDTGQHRVAKSPTRRVTCRACACGGFFPMSVSRSAIRGR
jgi:hypothetical protein